LPDHALHQRLGGAGELGGPGPGRLLDCQLGQRIESADDSLAVPDLRQLHERLAEHRSGRVQALFQPVTLRELVQAVGSRHPVAALLTDLKQRGLLEDTLVLWGGEFGRTPTAQGDGREHHPFGFTMWLTGAGIRGGMVHGATDEFGWHAVQDRVHIHDLHATILHLMGIDHERFTYRYGGRDYRLTDVYGKVVRPIIQG
jgi:hypothetical protein